MNLFAQNKHNPLTQKIRSFCAIIIFVIIGAVSFGYAPSQAHAISVTVTGGPGTVADIESAIANTATAVGLGSLVKKEFALDGILFAIAKLVISQMTRSIIRWINSGFDGSPAFIQDLGGFLIDVADEAAGEFINGTELGFLCRPFQVEIRLGLSLNYRASTGGRVQCTVSGVAANVERFLNGDFLAGNPGSWLEMTAYPNGNFFSAQANAQRLLFEHVNNRITINLNKLAWGDGFLSKAKNAACALVGKEENCTITMPGKAISEALTFELSVGSRTLIEADEINEVVSALLAQLAQQALQGVGGLLGLSATGGSYGSTSYLDRMGDSTYDSTIGGGTAGGEEEDGLFGSAINDENEYRALYANIVSRAQAIIVQAQSTQGCTNVDSIITQTNPILNEALQRQSAAESNLILLRNLQSRYNTADEEERLAIAQELAALETSGQLHTRYTNIDDKFYTDEVLVRLANIASQLNSLCGTPGGGQSGGE